MSGYSRKMLGMVMTNDQTLFSSSAVLYIRTMTNELNKDNEYSDESQVKHEYLMNNGNNKGKCFR